MSASVGERLRPLTIIWGAMLGGTVAYTAMLYGLVLTGILDFAAFAPEVMNLVGAGAILLLVGAAFYRRRLVAGIGDVTELDERLARYGNVNVVAMALMEGAGLLVISFGMLAGAPGWIAAGGGASAVAMLFARPSAAEVEG